MSIPHGSSLEGPSWIFPEMASFLVRFSEIMAICCIAEMTVIGPVEKCLLILCSAIFLLNCFEFSRPPKKVMFTYTLSALLSAVCVILMILEASMYQRYSAEKYYVTLFQTLAVSGSAIIMGYFYRIHHRSESKS